MKTIFENTLFTNVAKTEDGGVYWEGMDESPSGQIIDWQGKPWTEGCGRNAAHPNSRCLEESHSEYLLYHFIYNL